MIEFLATEIAKIGTSIAKNILEKRVEEKNKQLLKKKKEKRKKSLSSSAQEILTKREEVKADLLIPSDENFESISQHVSYVETWSNEIKFSDLSGPKFTQKVYVDLDTYIIPIRKHIDISEKNNKSHLNSAIFSNNRHSIVLGPPGAGKTTSMKKICSLFFEAPYNIPYNFPILIRLRDLNKDTDVSIKKELLTVFNFEVVISGNKQAVTPKIKSNWDNEVFYAILDQLQPLIVFDGFDELSTETQKSNFLSQFRALSLKLKCAKMILTCRSGEFKYSVERASIFEIASLSTNQIKKFAVNWLESKVKANKFLKDIDNSPFSDTAIKPLSLAHLCAIYERIGKIPDQPKTVYRKVVSLLLSEWDEQRSIKRVSKYSKFEVDMKLEFLANLSFQLTISGFPTVFDQGNLLDAYHKIRANFELPEHEAISVVSEIESHTGLVLRAGYKKYEFAHKSLQEFLTAEYLVRLPNLKSIHSNINFLCAELAVACAISSNSSLYFSDVVLTVLCERDFSKSFFNIFVSRLINERVIFFDTEDFVLAMFTLLDEIFGGGSLVEDLCGMIDNCDLNHLLSYYKIDSHNSDDSEFCFIRWRMHPSYQIRKTLKFRASELSEPVFNELLSWHNEE